MNAFDSEVRERKRLVSSARHKKNGSKSKRCSLPSDHLTERQWKARCGEIMEYKLSSPVPWAEFKRYPRDIQEMYIQNMVEKYHVTASDLGRLFGCHYATISRFCQKQGLHVPFAVGRRMSAKEKAAFEKLFDQEKPVQEAVTAQETAELEYPDVEELDKVPPMSMRSFSVHFDGPFDPTMVLNSLSSILHDGERVSIYITCEISQNEEAQP